MTLPTSNDYIYHLSQTYNYKDKTILEDGSPKYYKNITVKYDHIYWTIESSAHVFASDTNADIAMYMNCRGRQDIKKDILAIPVFKKPFNRPVRYLIWVEI